MSSAVFVGIDVSGAVLDVAVRPEEEVWQVAHDARGIRTLVRRLRLLAPALVVLEATSTLHVAVSKALLDAGVPVAVQNPRQIRDFGRATGKLAKTDTVDARIIARYAEAVRPAVRELPDEAMRHLQGLLTRRRQVSEMRQAEQHHRRTAHPAVQREIASTIRRLGQEQRKLERRIAEAIAAHPEWRRRAAVLRSVPGVGLISTAMLIAYLPELGNATDKQLAALVGVAPLNRDSGLYRGRRMIWGGRKYLRNVLYMAALVASSRNRVVRTWYEKLLAAGKPRKLALIACVRKLLAVLNIMTMRETAWAPVAP